MTVAGLLGLVLLTLVLPGTVELLAVTLGALWSRQTRREDAPPENGAMGRIAVVIPAHNEASGIEACIASVQAGLSKRSDFDIVVIADNCSDETAELARGCGVRVLERFNETLRGKGYALDEAFRTLLAEDYAGFVVIDADTRVEASFGDAFAAGFAAEWDATQCGYLVANEDEHLRSRLSRVALACFNLVRPAGREALGVSVGILGNGFALRASTLRAVPYEASSIVEDLEYHLRLVAAGLRVRFLAGTIVRAEMPEQESAAASQRARWEGGRLRMALDHVPQLAAALLRGNGWAVEPLGELLLLPLGYHALLLVAGASLLAMWSPWWGVAVLLAGVGVLLLHVVTAFRFGVLLPGDGAALLRVPGYVLWKLGNLGGTLKAADKQAAWVRTERNAETENGDDRHGS